MMNLRAIRNDILSPRQLTLGLPPNVDLCSIPLGRHPDGLPPNFDNPTSLKPTLIAMIVITITTAIIVASGRLYANRKTFRLADYFIACGLILNFGIAGVLLALSRYYRHDWDIPACWLNMTFVETLIVGPTLFFPKAAIFLFYLQIFSIKRSVRIGSKVGLVMTFLTYFPTSLAFCYFSAPHVGQSWDDVLALGLSEKGLLICIITMSVASVILDIYIFILPLPTLFSLNISFSKRMQLTALFTTAFMGIIASIVSLAYRIKILGLEDYGWQQGRVAIAIIVESNIAIIVGSLPIFVSFLRIHVAESNLFKSLRSKLSSGSGSRSRGSNFDQGRSWQSRTPWTHGSPHQPQPQYYELSDAIVLNSQVTAPEEALTATHRSDQGILRTVGFSQEIHTHQSSDRLMRH